jgi:hypothetical protein
MPRKAARKLTDQIAEARPLPATSAKIEVVATHFVAGIGAKRQRVPFDVRQCLGQQRALNLPGCIEILLHTGEGNVALMVAGIFKSHGSLQREALNKVGLVESELATVRRNNDQIGHAGSVAIVQRPGEQGAFIGTDGFRRVVTIHQAGGGESRAGHLELPHDDAQHLLEDLIFMDGGVDLARGLKERLQARYLLLQVDRFATAWKLNPSSHRALRGISL